MTYELNIDLPLGRKFDKRPPKVSSSLNYSMTLWKIDDLFPCRKHILWVTKLGIWHLRNATDFPVPHWACWSWCHPAIMCLRYGPPDICLSLRSSPHQSHNHTGTSTQLEFLLRGSSQWPRESGKEQYEAMHKGRTQTSCPMEDYATDDTWVFRCPLTSFHSAF